jgi:parallel beta-helix repeat protein
MNNLIEDNIIFNGENTGGIYGVVLHISATFNNISNNEIYGYSKGIWIYYGSCNDNTIYGNYIHDNLGGIHNWKADRIKILNNTITRNTYSGISDDLGKDFIISGTTPWVFIY